MEGLRALKYHLAWIFFLFSGSVLSPAATKRLSQYGVATWSQDQGLLSGSVLSLSQSLEGYLQVGTTAGLLRFDGMRFRALEAAQNLSGSAAIILCQLQAPDGTLWLGTNGGGLIRLQGKQSRTITTADGLPSSTVNALHLDASGTLWIGTSQGLASWRQGRLHPAPSPASQDSVWSISDDGQNGLLVATFGHGLLRGKDNQFSRVESLPAREVRTVFRSRQGEWWASVPGVGVYRSTGTNWQPLSSARHPLLDVWSFAEDRHGHIWIASGAEGLARWDGQQMELLSESGGLEHGYVLNVFVDREGNVWTGARSGLSRFRDDFLTAFTTREGLPSNMLGPLLEIEPGRWLVGTQNAGAAFWHPSTGTSTAIPELRDHKVFAIHRQSPSDYWIGTDRGLALLHHHHVQLPSRHAKLPSPFVFSIAPASAGSLWIGTLAGLCLYRNSHCQPFDFSQQLPQKSLFAIHAGRDGTLWLGYGEGSLCRRDPQGVRCWGDQDGLAGGDVFDFQEDEAGDLWVACMNGLARIHQGQLQWLNQRNGLPFHAIYGITTDAAGHWWLSSGEGLFRTTLADLREALAGRSLSVKGTHFNTGDGMLSPATTAGVQPSASLDSQGNLWFSTNRGAVLAPHESPSAPLPPPQALLEEVVLDGKTFPADANISLAASAHNLELHFTALSLSVPERSRFAYQLEGFDRTWIPVGNRRTAFYSSLPPGNYTFRVRSAGLTGPWGPPSPSLNIQQLPAWWQTPWFQLACLLAAFSTVWLWNRRRLQIAQDRFQAVLAERTRIARDLHDTLLGDFTGFSMHLAALSLPPRDVVPASEVDRLVERMEQSLREARQAIQLLRAQDPSPAQFFPLLETLCRGICEARSIDFQFNAPPNPPSLDQPTRDCLQRIVVEAVRNAVKHSEATRIEVSVELAQGKLRAVITDNGSGFSEDALQGKTSFGVRGMRERAAAVAAQLHFHSRPTGTTVELLLPRPSSHQQHLA